MAVLTASLAALLGAVFLLSALPKLRHPKGFVLTILEYEVLPPTLGNLYARLLPPLELLAALLLLSGVFVRCAATAVSSMLVSFIVGIGINLARGRDLDCGCFRKGNGRRINPGLLLQDAVLLAASVLLVSLSGGWLVPAPWSLLHLGGVSSTAALAACAVVTLACAAALPRWRRRHKVWKAASGRERRVHANVATD